MIKLSRIHGEEVYINENNIQWIEATPDTTITFMNGHRFIVREKLQEVLKLIANSHADMGYLTATDKESGDYKNQLNS